MPKALDFEPSRICKAVLTVVAVTMSALLPAQAYASGTTLVNSQLTIASSADLAPGDLILQDSTLTITGNMTAGNAVTLLGNGGTFNTSDTILTLTGNVSGSGGLIKSGSGYLMLNGGASYTGATVVQAGRLFFNNYSQSVTNNVATSSIAIARDLNVTFWGTHTVSAPITGLGSLFKDGAGKLTLGGSNTYRGATGVFGGELLIDRGASLGTGGLFLETGTLTNAGDLVASNAATLMGSGGTFNTSGGYLTFNGGVSGVGGLIKSGSNILTFNGAASYTGATTIQGGTLRFQNNGTAQAALGTPSIDIANGASLTFAGAFSLNAPITGAGQVVKEGLGKLTLTGTNTYIGGTTVRGGELSIDSIGNLGQGGLTLQGGTFTNEGALTFGNTVNLLGSGGTFNTSGGDLTFNGIVSGVGSLIKTGMYTLSLNGDASYSGGTTVSDGTLAIARSANLGTGGLILQGGTFTNTGNVITTNDVILQGTGGTFNTQGGYLSFNGGVSGSGGLVKSGSRILTFNGDASYTGATVIQAGTLKFQNNGQASAHVGTASIDIASGARMLFTGSHTVGAPITGAGQLVHEFGGTTTLTGNATHTGGTSIVGGQLRVGNGGTTGSLSGTVSTDTGTLAFDRSDNTAFNGSIQGTGGVIKAGAGQLALSGTHTYTGTTTVEAGELKLNGNIAGSAVTVQAGARLSGNAQVGDLTVAGDLNPGNSPGLLTAGNTTFMGGGQFVWELQDANGAAGVGYDTLNVNGTLTFGGGSTPFVVALRTLALDGSAGDVAGFNVTVDHRFTLVSTTGGILNYSPASMQLSLAGFSNDLLGGRWSIEQAGKSLDLVYTAAVTSVPEPEGWVLALGGVLVVLCAAWCERQSASA
jgi:fibronectin-binding autotransporter adhesin